MWHIGYAIRMKLVSIPFFSFDFFYSWNSTNTYTQHRAKKNKYRKRNHFVDCQSTVIFIRNSIWNYFDFFFIIILFVNEYNVYFQFGFCFSLSLSPFLHCWSVHCFCLLLLSVYVCLIEWAGWQDNDNRFQQSIGYGQYQINSINRIRWKEAIRQHTNNERWQTRIRMETV